MTEENAMNMLTVSGQQALPAIHSFPIPTVAPIANLAKAISAVMSEVGVVGKDGVNQFHRYAYAKMEDILQTLTPLIAKAGLVIMQTETSRAMFDDDKVISITYQFTIAHTSGEIWPERMVQTGMCRCRDSKGGFDDKALNKCHTAARKYFLLALFQVPTGDDADAGPAKRPARQDDDEMPARDIADETPAPNDEPAKLAGRMAANGGNATLRTWSDALPREQRARLKPHIMRELMPVAEAVDAAATAAAAKAAPAPNNAPAATPAPAKPSPPRPAATEAAQTENDMI